MQYKVVIIGGSAGSIKVLCNMLREIPVDFPVPIVIVLHRKAGAGSDLHNLFDRLSPLTVKEAVPLEVMEKGRIYLCPPDFHLLVDESARLYLDRDEKVNYCRPAVDVSFESFSWAFGEGVIAVVLTGANEDGAKGAWHVKRRGGRVLIQSPESSEARQMPVSAIQELNEVDGILPPEKLSEKIKSIIDG